MSHCSKDRIEFTMIDFKENILNYTKKDKLKYEGLMYVVGTLVNNEHIFYSVVEEVFTESMLEWQKSKDLIHRSRINRLTEIITDICKLKSPDYFHGACY